jgi:regulatory protein
MPGTITALEIQKRDKERVNVYLDGEFAFGLTLIEAARLRRGQTLSDSEIATLKAQDEIERAVEQAVRFLSYRPRSTSEIRQNLQQKGFAPPAIDTAINRLESLGYVDDLAFARYWVANRDEFRPKGPLALRQELRQKGVSNAAIEQALSEVDFADAAYRAAQQRAARWQRLDRPAFQQKVYEHLARRGFRSETIQDVMNRLLEEYEIPEQDKFDYDAL